MKIINLGEGNSVLNRFMAQLRQVNLHDKRSLFRYNLNRIGQIMAYEVSRTLDYSEKQVQTPLGMATASTFDNRIVVGTVLRAGLAFQEGFTSVFDDADCGFVAAYREEGSGAHLKVHLEYMAAPDIEGSTFLLVDPMLATGGSIEAAYHAFLKNGRPETLHICVVIASQPGIAYLQKLFPSDHVTLWTAAIDPALNEASYIVPGLGDAGDLSFGEKK